MKKQVRLRDNDPLNNPADKVLDTLGRTSNIASQQDVRPSGQEDVQPASQEDINITSHKATDVIRKLTFQVRDSIFEQLKDAHYYLGKELGEDAPDREVIVEEAIARVLEQLKNEAREDLTEALVRRQKIRQAELATGLLKRAGKK
jgi:hypothetical protein